MILLISDPGWDVPRGTLHPSLVSIVPRGTIGSGYIVLHRQDF